MIHSVSSTLPTFKNIAFSAGLNVLIADTVEEAPGKTRNSAGKTSLIEVFHFLFGSSNTASPMFQDPRLINHDFSLKYDTPRGIATASRNGAQPNRIAIVSGSDAFATSPVAYKVSGIREYTREQYARSLGETFFGLPYAAKKSTHTTYSPTFRSLISYLIRRDYEGAFQDAERNGTKQTPWDVQVNLSFALGLDWRIAREFQLVRDREKKLKMIKAAAKSGTFGSVIDSSAALRARLAKAQKKATTLRDQIQRFVVADAYNELAADAARLKTQISKALTQNLAERMRLEQLRQLLQREQQPSEGDLVMLFDEMNAQLPEHIQRRFEDVKIFHESVMQNRRYGLESEAATAESRIAKRNIELEIADVRRAEIIAYLSGRGAFEDFLNLQKELSRQEVAVAALQRQFDVAQLLEGQKASLEIERQNLLRRLQSDFNAHSDDLNEAIVLVDQLVSEFYDDRGGELLVEATDNGPNIQMQIEGDRGGGISKIEIFCFDIAIAKMLRRLGIGPNVLVHDSHLFDGVDERQISKALEIGLREAQASSFQYIVTMNSDMWRRLSFSDASAMNACILPIKLDDRREEGSLFGIQLQEKRQLNSLESPNSEQ